MFGKSSSRRSANLPQVGSDEESDAHHPFIDFSPKNSGQALVLVRNEGIRIYEHDK